MTIQRFEPSAILSHCVSAGGLVITAGIVADDTTADVRGQTQQILAKIDALLAAAGTSKARILSAQIWLTDITTRAALNEVWLGWVDKDNLPARACVEARLADPSLLVEIQVTALK